MERALAHLQGELSNIRTGRATPGMLDHLKVGWGRGGGWDNVTVGAGAAATLLGL